MNIKGYFGSIFSFAFPSHKKQDQIDRRHQNPLTILRLLTTLKDVREKVSNQRYMGQHAKIPQHVIENERLLSEVSLLKEKCKDYKKDLEEARKIGSSLKEEIKTQNDIIESNNLFTQILVEKLKLEKNRNEDANYSVQDDILNEIELLQEKRDKLEMTIKHLEDNVSNFVESYKQQHAENIALKNQIQVLEKRIQIQSYKFDENTSPISTKTISLKQSQKYSQTNVPSPLYLPRNYY